MIERSFDILDVAKRYVRLAPGFHLAHNSSGPEADAPAGHFHHNFDVVDPAGKPVQFGAICVLTDSAGGFSVEDWRSTFRVEVAKGSVPDVHRLLQIEAELEQLGYRMAHSLSALDGEGHAIVEIASGETVDESTLPPRVIDLASEWSRLEGVEDEEGASAPGQACPEKLSQDELRRRLQKLVDQGLQFPDCMSVLGEERDLSPYARAAAERYHRDGELEFDDRLIVSKGDDPGAYVLCWRWIDDSDVPEYSFTEGDEVWWFDPDRDLSSGLYQVVNTDHPELVVLDNEAGSRAEVRRHELVKIDRKDVAEWVGLHYKVNFDSEPQDRKIEWLGRWAQAQRETFD